MGGAAPTLECDAIAGSMLLVALSVMGTPRGVLAGWIGARDEGVSGWNASLPRHEKYSSSASTLELVTTRLMASTHTS